MSRIPQPSSSRPMAKPDISAAPSTPRPRVLNSITSTPRIRTQSPTIARSGSSTATTSTPKLHAIKPNTPTVRKAVSTASLKQNASTPKPNSPTKPKAPASQDVNNSVASPSTPSLSIREAIALKRAQAKKAQAKFGSMGGGLESTEALDDALPPHAIPAQEEEDLLGRASLRETIEKARSTGSLNVATRSLKCLPSALFEIHLGITPDPLKSVPEEPPLPPTPAETPTGRTSNKNPAWFEAQDLQVLKAWTNEIEEIQHEISLFGSLKIIDFHNNKLSSIPESLADLSMLTTLDLSHNQLTTLPNVLFALPELTSLNISYNTLTSLPFNAHFVSSNSRRGNDYSKSTDPFAPAIVRAISPLPRLVILNASHNKLSAKAIDPTLPRTLTKIDLSENPLGPSQPLLRTLAGLPRLKEILMEKADIGDDSFPPDVFPASPFPNLKVFDLSETKATLEAVCTSLRNLKQELDHNFTQDEPVDGITRVIVGKKVVKEAWEIELERRSQHRVNRSHDLSGDWDEPLRQTSISPAPSSSSNVNSVRSMTSSRTTKSIQDVIKEGWEMEAEAGLLTEGGRRRARAMAAHEEANKSSNGIGLGRPQSLSRSSSTTSLTLASPQYYNQNTQTLTLPPSQPPKAVGHGRTFSLATKITLPSSPLANVAVPQPSLPLNVITTQPFAHSLRSLILVNRRADRSFALPSSAATDPDGFLPCLEELDLEGCNLLDSVPTLRADAHSPTSSSNARTTEPLLPLLATLFPSLRTLNLSYNALTSAALTSGFLSDIILSSHPNNTHSEQGTTRKGLRHLRLRGNKITDLDGFVTIAGMFKGNREVLEWKLEELDLRDNEIGRLPPELGLLPLEVFLVDGNTFRVPQRRVWEREGTKGLLSWLRGRIE